MCEGRLVGRLSVIEFEMIWIQFTTDSIGDVSDILMRWTYFTYTS